MYFAIMEHITILVLDYMKALYESVPQLHYCFNMNNETSYVQSLYFETMLSVWYYGTLLYVASFWCIAREKLCSIVTHLLKSPNMRQCKGHWSAFLFHLEHTRLAALFCTSSKSFCAS